MTKENYRQIFISILIGAGVAFFSTLFEQLAAFLKAHSTELISGTATSFYYITRRFNIT